MTYLIASLLLLVVGIGFGSWAAISAAFKTIHEWDEDQHTMYDSILTSICMLGSAFGALLCEPFFKYGKLKIMIYMNVLLIASISLCMINVIWVITIGRFFWGVSFGCMSVVCAKYSNEICPIEYKGPFGALNQNLLCFGMCIPTTMALAIPNPPKDKEDWYVNFYWRLIWLAPLVIAVIQTILLLTCYNHETPVHLLERGETKKLGKVMRKIYQTKEIDSRT